MPQGASLDESGGHAHPESLGPPRFKYGSQPEKKLTALEISVQQPPLPPDEKSPPPVEASGSHPAQNTPLKCVKCSGEIHCCHISVEEAPICLDCLLEIGREWREKALAAEEKLSKIRALAT